MSTPRRRSVFHRAPLPKRASNRLLLAPGLRAYRWEGVLEAPWPVDEVEQELFGLLQFQRHLRSLVAALTDDRSDLLVTRPPKPQLFRGGPGDSRDLGRRQRCLGEALDLPANAIGDARRELHSTKSGRRKDSAMSRKRTSSST